MVSFVLPTWVFAHLYAPELLQAVIYLFSSDRLQEPAVIAVDRLHRFRWSGGGGGSGKKSSSGPRSEKAERLRELTEKLKGPAPVPPPRRPSRVQASSPPASGYQPSFQNYPQVRNSNVTVTRVWRLLLRTNEWYFTLTFLYFQMFAVAKKKNVYLLSTFEHYYEIKYMQKLFNNLYYFIYIYIYIIIFF